MRIKDEHKIHDMAKERPIPPLSQIEKDDLRRIIGEKVSPEKISAIEKSFISASFRYHKLSQVNLQPFAERKKSIEKMLNGLKNMRLAMDEIDVFVEFMFDTHFAKVSEGKSIEQFRPDNYFMSGFNNLIDLMKKTLESYNDELPEPTKGKQANHDYTASIDIIAKAFKAQIPKAKISSSGKSRFFKIIQLWLSILHPEETNIDAEKHIKNYKKTFYFNKLN